MNQPLNHFDTAGNAVMVDVSQKNTTLREAVATGSIRMNRAAFSAVASGTAAKGDVLGVARVAGIQAAKRTAELIPMCHPVLIEKTAVDFTLDAETQSVRVVCRVRCSGKTGVEMEALCGAGVALLTVYDMCKAADRGMVVSDICLLEKSGGAGGDYRREESGNPV